MMLPIVIYWQYIGSVLHKSKDPFFTKEISLGLVGFVAHLHLSQVGKDYKVHFADRLPNALRPSI